MRLIDLKSPVEPMVLFVRYMLPEVRVVVVDGSSVYSVEACTDVAVTPMASSANNALMQLCLFIVLSFP
jgi:hypothetical protein